MTTSLVLVIFGVFLWVFETQIFVQFALGNIRSKDEVPAFLTMIGLLFLGTTLITIGVNGLGGLR